MLGAVFAERNARVDHLTPAHDTVLDLANNGDVADCTTLSRNSCASLLLPTKVRVEAARARLRFQVQGDGAYRALANDDEPLLRPLTRFRASGDNTLCGPTKPFCQSIEPLPAKDRLMERAPPLVEVALLLTRLRQPHAASNLAEVPALAAPAGHDATSGKSTGTTVLVLVGRSRRHDRHESGSS